MVNARSDDIRRLLDDDAAIERALLAAVADARLAHKRAGNPIAIWRDGRVVWIPAEEIVVEDTPRA